MENQLYQSERVIAQSLTLPTRLDLRFPAAPVAINRGMYAEQNIFSPLRRSLISHEPNYWLGTASASVASGIVVLIWTLAASITGYPSGYISMSVGLLAGYFMRQNGKGTHKRFGLTAAGITLAGCAVGGFLSMIGVLAVSESMGYLEVLSLLSVNTFLDILTEVFRPLFVLYYGVAMYLAYRFSFRSGPNEKVSPLISA